MNSVDLQASMLKSLYCSSSIVYLMALASRVKILVYLVHASVAGFPSAGHFAIAIFTMEVHNCLMFSG